MTRSSKKCDTGGRQVRIETIFLAIEFWNLSRKFCKHKRDDRESVQIKKKYTDRMEKSSDITVQSTCLL